MLLITEIELIHAVNDQDSLFTISRVSNDINGVIQCKNPLGHVEL